MGELEARHGGRAFFRSQLFQPMRSFSSPCLTKLWVRQTGAIMYALASIDFSDQLGFVVSKLPPEEIDTQDQTVETKRSLPTSALEEAVFGAA